MFKEILKKNLIPIFCIVSVSNICAAQFIDSDLNLGKNYSNKFTAVNNPRKISTNYHNLFAYEQKDNSYFWQVRPSVSAVIKEAPRAYSINDDIPGGPITFYNKWPAKLGNVSIFPYLLASDNNQQYNDLYAFIKEWYQSACAIIHRSSHIDSKVVGSGGLINDVTIVTARHNCENIPPNNLYVRFFKYFVKNTVYPNFLYIEEMYLDIPVVEITRASEGLDACYLTIPILANSFFDYAKVLPRQITMFTHLIPIGHYGMFHFAEGKPQFSIGEVTNPPMGSPLHNKIALQAGPGASGGVILRKAFREVNGGGISIYRLLENGNVDRRIISFSQIQNPLIGSLDDISAPYRKNPNFYVIPSYALFESGYEFLHWLDEAHINRRGMDGKKFPKPKYDLYKVQDDRHGTHHIIPIDDMIFLWEYFYTLDTDTCNRLRQQAANEAVEFGKRNYDKTLDREARYINLYNEEIRRQYGKFHEILDNLYPSFYENRELKYLNTHNGFAWSLWNLFQGWDGNYRRDDPKQLAIQMNSKDFSERNQPPTFDNDLWVSIKLLYDSIQQLKRICASTYIPDRSMENIIYQRLTNLKTRWLKMDKKLRSIHKYNEADWQIVKDRKDGHELYIIKTE